MQVPPIAGFLQKFDSNPDDPTKPVANYRQHSNAAMHIESRLFQGWFAGATILFRLVKNCITFTFA